MGKIQALVQEFHEAFGHEIGGWPKYVSMKQAKLRCELIAEEAQEVLNAIGNQELPDIAKELADLIYVTYGAAIVYGIDLDEVVAEVHRSNMTKLGEDGKPIYREDGKALKGPNYEPADVKRVLTEQRAADLREAFAPVITATLRPIGLQTFELFMGRHPNQDEPEAGVFVG